MQCPYCGNDVNAGVSRCPSCGASIPHNAPQASYASSSTSLPSSAMQQPAGANAAKSKMAYILLGVFAGGLGIHNFYAGYTTKGVIQALISVVGGAFTAGLASLISEIWALIEVCNVRKDASGVPFV